MRQPEEHLLPALPPTPCLFTVVEARELMAKAMALFEAGVAGDGYAGGAAAVG
jgi:hypothetical protein